MRYLRFRAWLDSVATDIAQPAAIYFEEVRGHAVRTQNLYGGFLASAAWERRACLHHWRGDRPRCRCGRLRSGRRRRPAHDRRRKTSQRCPLGGRPARVLWRSGSFDGGDRDALVNHARPAGHGRPGVALPDRSEARKAGSRGWRKRSAGCTGSNGTTSSSSGHDRNARLGKQSAAGLGSAVRQLTGGISTRSA